MVYRSRCAILQLLPLLFCAACAGQAADDKPKAAPPARLAVPCADTPSCSVGCNDQGSGAACFELGVRQLTAALLAAEESGESGTVPSAEQVYAAAQTGEAKETFVRAAELLGRACTAKEHGSCWYLGRLFSEGWGVTQDQARAIGLLLESCEQGVADACTQIGWQFYEGLAVAKDPQRAVELLERGCEGGHWPACESLGSVYATGDGAPKDVERATTLLDKACAGGRQGACEQLAGLRRE